MKELTNMIQFPERKLEHISCQSIKKPTQSKKNLIIQRMTAIVLMVSGLFALSLDGNIVCFIALFFVGLMLLISKKQILNMDKTF